MYQLNTLPPQVTLKPIPSAPFYAAGSDGEIYSLRRNHRLARSYVGNKKYAMVRVREDGHIQRRLVHRLVAEAFHGPCPAGLETNHKNSDKADCRPGNLEYTTRRRNFLHAIENGRIVLKLSPADVRAIRRSNWSQRSLAVHYGVSRCLIWQIQTRCERRSNSAALDG